MPDSTALVVLVTESSTKKYKDVETISRDEQSSNNPLSSLKMFTRFRFPGLRCLQEIQPVSDTFRCWFRPKQHKSVDIFLTCSLVSLHVFDFTVPTTQTYGRPPF